jgi:hypothetical protein
VQARISRHPGRDRRCPYTSEPDYTDAELEFMYAVHAYKQQSGNQFPALHEILKVLIKLGYHK